MSYTINDITEETTASNIEDTDKFMGASGTVSGDDRKWSFGTLWSWIKIKLEADAVAVKELLGSHQLAFIGLYQNTTEALTVGPSTFASPGSNVNIIPVSGTANAVHDFSYGGGTIEYTGTTPKYFECRANISYSNSSPNTLTSFYWAKNWTSGSPSATDLLSVASETTSTSSQKPNLTLAWVVLLEEGDTLDVVVKADNSSTATVQVAKYLIKEISDYVV